MYIPKEMIIYFLGFISFPILCYIIYKLKGMDKEDGDDN